jgi:hypothetical protein
VGTFDPAFQKKKKKSDVFLLVALDIYLSGDLRLLTGATRSDSFDTSEQFGHLLIDVDQRGANLILTFQDRAKFSIVFSFELEDRHAY